MAESLFHEELIRLCDLSKELGGGLAMCPPWANVDDDLQDRRRLLVYEDEGFIKVDVRLLPYAEDQALEVTEGGSDHRRLIRLAATWFRSRGLVPTLQNKQYVGGGRLADLVSTDGTHIFEAGRATLYKLFLALNVSQTWCHAPFYYPGWYSGGIVVVFTRQPSWEDLDSDVVEESWPLLRARMERRYIAKRLREDLILRQGWVKRECGDEIYQRDEHLPPVSQEALDVKAPKRAANWHRIRNEMARKAFFERLGIE